MGKKSANREAANDGAMQARKVSLLSTSSPSSFPTNWTVEN